MLGFILAVAALLAGTAAAQSLPPGLVPSETVLAVEALDGDTIRLHDGRELRLAGVAAPKPLLPRADAAPKPDRRFETLVTDARRHLDEKIRGQPLALYPTATLPDRHGRIVAYAVTPAGDWLQAKLVGEGFAVVQTIDGTTTGLAPLLRIEALARGARRGMWAHPLYHVRTPEEAGRWLDTFQLVEGRVATVRNGRSSSRFELGTGERRLTVIVAAKTRAALRIAGVDLLALAGRAVRVRGWLRWQDGARLDLAHADALELLDP